MNPKILVADDEARMRILVSDFLTHEGYDVVEARDGKEALEQFTSQPNFQAVILDVMMPNVDGWEVLEAIRQMSQVPVIMLTAMDTEKDELRGFRGGADEYITKPFSPTILVARINALLKRTGQPVKRIDKGDIHIDLQRHTVKIRDESVELSQTEYRMLLYFIENESKVLSREQLLNNIWGFDYYGTDRTVDTHINRLRVKLKTAGEMVMTIRGYGYKFEVNG